MISEDDVLDLLIIGGGPAGLYTSLIVQKATPVQSVSENFNVAVVDAGKFGGLTKYAYIQITKHWAFSGSKLTATLFDEAVDAGVKFFDHETVLNVEKKNNIFIVTTTKNVSRSKFVVVATGIMTFPDVMADGGKSIIGLHTPDEMVKEIIQEHHWKNVLVVGNHEKSTHELAEDLMLSGMFDVVNNFVTDVDAKINDAHYGIPENILEKYDGLVFDYGSYKIINGTTNFLKKVNLRTLNGYLITNQFGESSLKGLYAAGSVTTPVSGVPFAISSGQVVGFDIGRQLRKASKADPSGRFPYYPREQYWDESWQKKLSELK